jgi:Putative adhesin
VSAPPGQRGPDPRQSRRRRRAWLVVALVTGLVVALVSGLGVVNKLAQQGYSGFAVYRQQVDTLAVDADSGSVTVRPGPPGEVTVRQNLQWVTVRPTVRVGHDGGTLTVSVRCDDHGLLAELGCSADLTILVPPQTALTSTGASGDLTVQRLSGSLNLGTSSGDIVLDQVSGPVQIVSDSGNLDAEGLRCVRFQARTGSGPVHAVFAAPPQQVQVTSDSGPVDLGLPRGSGYRLSGRSDSGPRNVDETLSDATATATITVNTTSGPVSIGY